MIKQKQFLPKRRFEGFNDKWRQFFISEFCEIKTGGTPSTKILAYWYPAEIPWMSSGEVNKKRVFDTDIKISKAGLNNSSARWIKKDSILIGLAGQGKTRGTVAINKIPLTSNQSIAAIELKNSFNPEFLFQNLGNRYEELRTMSSGDGSRGGLNKKIISEIKVFLPNDKEQQKIGQFFKHLDEMIALQQRKIDKIKALKSAYLIEMFPAKGKSVPKRRFDGFTNEWEVKKLADIVTEISDGDWIETEHIFNQGKYRIIQTGNLGIGRYINRIKNAKYFHQENFDKLKANEIFPGDILVSRLAEPAGRTIILPETGFRMVTSVDVAVIRPNEEFDSIFLMTLMNSEKTLKEINKEVTGTTHKRISRKNLERNELIVPKVFEQQKIGQFFKYLDDTILVGQKKLDKLKAMKQAYLHEMFV